MKFYKIDEIQRDGYGGVAFRKEFGTKMIGMNGEMVFIKGMSNNSDRNEREMFFIKGMKNKADRKEE